MGEISRLLDKQSAEAAIGGLGLEDLRYLNRLIVDRINRLVKGLREQQLGQFLPGNRVSFKTLEGEEKIGVVIRVNQKTVSVSTGDGVSRWKVSPGALTKIASDGPR